MQGLAVGITNRKVTVPGRGERVATWVEDYLAQTGRTLSELAFQAKADKRDLQRLIRDRSCGHRLEDQLAETFGWSFVDAVMAPAVGGDRLSMLEKEFEKRQAEAAAIHARIERERAVFTSLDADRRPPLRAVGRATAVQGVPGNGGPS